MARIRSLKPEFFMSDSTGAVSFGARLLFAGLWTLVDREGRWIWRPKMVKAQIFPHDRDEVIALEEWATELVRADMVRFYQDDEAVYVWLPGFLKHQRPHPKEPASVLPAWSAAHPKGWLPWKNTAGRELPGTIPSSPGGREGKGTDPDQEGKGREGGGYRASAPLVMSPLAWDRKHGGHLGGLCDWVCFPGDLAEQFASRAGWEVDRVRAWALAVRREWEAQRRVPTERMYDFWTARWSEAHPSTPSAAQSPVEAFKARQRAKASGGVA